MSDTLNPLIPRLIKYLLSLELFLGGQARLTNWTPRIRERALSKAPGYFEYLPFIPGKDPLTHSQAIGWLMVLAGSLLVYNRTRTIGALLSGSLSLMGVYAQRRMGVGYWLPVVNSIFAGIILGS